MLNQYLIELFHTALTKAYPEQIFTLEQIEVTRSTHERFGHYQCNSAMKLTKLLQKPPRDIAAKIIEALGEPKAIAKLEIAGPGFINITFSPTYLASVCTSMQQDKRLGVGTHKKQRIIVDFSSPNTAKEMHVGHLRSTIIGDCLARLLEFQGHDVLRLNHLGDWGTAFGMLIAYLKEYTPKILSGDDKAQLTTLVTAYKAAKALFDENEAFKKQSQLEVVALQSGDPQSLRAWKIICDISRKAYQEIYDLLDIKINERGESFYNPFLPEIIELLEGKNLISLSEGAKCMFIDGFQNREGLPLPLMLQKTDGGYNYATTDMAAIRHRIQTEKADRIIYVTDSGQATHFAMIFKAAEMAGILNSKQVQTNHVPFGLVLGPDGKKFKTRSGETERLIDLLQSGIDKAKEILKAREQDKQQHLSEVDLESLATALGINAIKYSDLSCNRNHDYAFSYEKMLRFEGNTAAFLMYSYVRINGIQRKIQGDLALGKIDLQHETEIALGLHLCQFAEVVESIAQDLMPNRLCDYLFELAEKFNAFFRDCRVEGSDEQNARLSLCMLTQNVLGAGLNMLGLKAVERM